MQPRRHVGAAKPLRDCRDLGRRKRGVLDLLGPGYAVGIGVGNGPRRIKRLIGQRGEHSLPHRLEIRRTAGDAVRMLDNVRQFPLHFLGFQNNASRFLGDDRNAHDFGTSTSSGVWPPEPGCGD